MSKSRYEACFGPYRSFPATSAFKRHEGSDKTASLRGSTIPQSELPFFAREQSGFPIPIAPSILWFSLCRSFPHLRASDLPLLRGNVESRVTFSTTALLLDPSANHWLEFNAQASPNDPRDLPAESVRLATMGTHLLCVISTFFQSPGRGRIEHPSQRGHIRLKDNNKSIRPPFGAKAFTDLQHVTRLARQENPKDHKHRTA